MTQYSATPGCTLICDDDENEVGPVGELLCWPQDTINTARQATPRGAINLGDFNDIGTPAVRKVSRPPQRQKVNHELKRRNVGCFAGSEGNW